MILDQVWLTNSGFFDKSAFLVALTAFGADRIIFSVDYPYSPNLETTAFIAACRFHLSTRLGSHRVM